MLIKKEYTCISDNDEQAAILFNEELKKLPNYSGIARISIEGFCGHIYYNQVTNKFEKQKDLGGYRKDSFVDARVLTDTEEENLYSDIKRGGIYVMVRYKEGYNFEDYCILKIKPILDF